MREPYPRPDWPDARWHCRLDITKSKNKWDGMKSHPESADIVARLNADRILQSEICETLERLADSLPEPPDQDLAGRLRAIIEPCWSEHVAFQESVIFPILLRGHAGAPALEAIVGQLESEHHAIAGSTHEIAEQLEIIARGQQPDAATFGYMLRAAFQERRHHIEWEQKILSSAIPKTLAPVDRDLFDRWLSTHGWPTHLLQPSWGIRN